LIDTVVIQEKALSLAFHGGLVPQNPEDETAEDLYARIHNIKSANTKALSEITGDDIPFVIPKSWKWVYLGELFEHNTGKALNSNNSDGQLMTYITTSNLYWDRFELNDLKQMRFTEKEIDKCTVRKGDLLVCEGGDIGRAAIWTYDYEMRIQNHIHRLRKRIGDICVDFYCLLLRYYKQIGLISGVGIGLQGFSSNRVHTLVVPLAPYKEQLRIVEKLREVFSTTELLDSMQGKYAQDRSILKSKIIHAAIQGKLTEQLPEDGTAEELYNRIKKEKEDKIKSGIVKREKHWSNNPAFQEYPFEIPDNWMFIRLGELMINRDNERVPVSLADRKKKAKIYDYYGASGVIDRVDEYLFDKELLLIGEDGANLVARSTPIAFVAKGLYWVNNHAHVLEACTGVNINYVCYYINSISLDKYITGTAQPKMNQENMNAIWVALPPLFEQNRIVDKLSELLPLCE